MGSTSRRNDFGNVVLTVVGHQGAIGMLHPRIHVQVSTTMQRSSLLYSKLNSKDGERRKRGQRGQRMLSVPIFKRLI